MRGNGASTETGANGRFILRDVDVNLPLFLRLSKPGYATTNTSYLNPRASHVEVVMLDAIDKTTVVIDGAAGLSLSASPAGIAKFSPANASGRITGSVDIRFQSAYPPQANDHEPNLIITVNPPGTDIVMPVFAGQVNYARIGAARK